MALQHISLRIWKGIILAAALLGTLLGMTVASAFGAEWSGILASGALSGGTWGGLALLVGSVNVKLNALAANTLTNREELRAMINIRPLLGPAPVQLGGWAMDAQFGELVAQTIFDTRPALVVECGSGSSTVLSTSCLHALEQGGQVVSLDHEDEYAHKTRRLLQSSFSPAEREATQVVHTPLKEYDLDGDTYRWYDIPDDLFEANSIDLLVVDGPPEHLNAQARFPAVPVLEPYLSESCVILMDDGNRSDERAIARHWAETLDASIQHIPNNKGAWVLHR
jgi:hypothetical protein